MKNKELKKFESVAFIMLEVLAKAVEMKKLQIEELKIKSQKKEFPSGGITSPENWTGKIVGTGLLSDEKEFIIPKRDLPIQGEGKKYTIPLGINIIEEGKSLTDEEIRSLPTLLEMIKKRIEEGEITEIKWASPKEIQEEALENGLKGEKKCKTAFDLIDKASPVGEPKKTNVDFEFPKRNFMHLSSSDNYFFVDRNKWKMFFGDTEKELFCFEDRDSRKIITLKTRDEVEFAIAQNLEIYFKWVRR